MTKEKLYLMSSYKIEQQAIVYLLNQGLGTL